MVIRWVACGSHSAWLKIKASVNSTPMALLKFVANPAILAVVEGIWPLGSTRSRISPSISPTKATLSPGRSRITTATASPNTAWGTTTSIVPAFNLVSA